MVAPMIVVYIADHEQHTCSPIIEISNKCDLECPICVVWNQKLQYN